MGETKADVVVDDGRAKFSDLWKKEDYWAIWLGFLVLIVGYGLFLAQTPPKFAETIDKANQTIKTVSAQAPFRTIEYYKAQADKKKLRARDSEAGKTIAAYTRTPGGWKSNPLDSFYKSKEVVDAANAKAKPTADDMKVKEDAALAVAQTAQKAAEAAGYKDAALNKAAEEKIGDWRKAQGTASKAKASASGKPSNIFPTLATLMVVFIVFFGLGMAFMGQNVVKFGLGFVGVFVVAVLAFMMGSQATMKFYGVNAEAWAIILGMIIANTVGTPSCIKPAVQTEYYIKTGLVLLGAEVLFDKIVAIGIPGIFVAWVVTPIVLICTFIFGQKVLKMPSKTLNITISADMSVCGTSAAIATAAACRAKKEELTLSIGLSLVFTAIMMIAMPAFIKAVGMPEVLGGAWIGGTIDSTGAVAAAGAFLGEKAMYVAATIKMIQNVLIGVTAFFVALYWTTKVEPEEQGYSGRQVGLSEIWNRFPKFVIGFLIASVLASLVSGSLGSDLSNAMVNEGLVRGLTSPLRTWCFVLAFTSIGLGTNFRELAHYFKGGKPLILYVCGQSFNLILTLIMAYVMFYIVFPEITAKI
ncbi:MAG: putative sulfate exporter family transporter [Desulfovibrio sp.]|nr:putative sulfate exporter family transporter [Desulfovibrio sp.]